MVATRNPLRLLLVTTSVMCIAGCGDDRPPAPERLLDGSRATAPKIDLDGLAGPMVATKVDVMPSGAVTACPGSVVEPNRPAVRRVGVNGISVTFASPLHGGVYACDSRSPHPSRDRAWCGRAFSRLRGGRLTDPRVDLTCLTAEGDPVAFVWIEPAAGTRFVAVRESGFVEVYEVAAQLPVRVTTTDVFQEESSAALDISEYGPNGALIRAYMLRAQVAG